MEQNVGLQFSSTRVLSLTVVSLCKYETLQYIANALNETARRSTSRSDKLLL